jgi:hypothetical protein
MAKHRLRGNMVTTDEIKREIRIELRSILRRWDELSKPAGTFQEVQGLPDGHPKWRLLDMRSAEEVHDRLYRFAGSVWQLKDRLKQWLSASGEKIGTKDTSGNDVETSIEETVKQYLPLLVCADLYNHKKHGQLSSYRCGRVPAFHGVQWKTNGLTALRTDGPSQTIDCLFPTPTPVEWACEVISTTSNESFGNGVVLIARAFHFLIPLLLQLGFLKPLDAEAQHLVDGMRRVQDFVARAPLHAA